jgi:ubiquinone/menaquinone biosynthesis C-methylase UbiE
LLLIFFAFINRNIAMNMKSVSMERKEHWEQVYNTKQPNEVSWAQETPATSLTFIHNFKVPRDAAIIDIGGGDSKLADHLLEEGYEDITVLDISEKALERAKQRLGERAQKIKWIVSDVVNFKPEKQYDVWHDRATFHFLTTSQEIQTYLGTAGRSVSKYMVIGTFSDEGPKKCSGLDIKQYTEPELQNLLAKNFEKIKCVTEDHITPFNTVQNFLFCSFKKSA